MSVTPSPHLAFADALAEHFGRRAELLPNEHGGVLAVFVPLGAFDVALQPLGPDHCLATLRIPWAVEQWENQHDAPCEAWHNRKHVTILRIHKPLSESLERLGRLTDGLSDIVYRCSSELAR